jgi:hypothetical protein
MKIKSGCGCALMVAAVCGGITVVFVVAAYSFVHDAVMALDTEAKPLPVPEISEEIEKSISKTEETFRQMTDGRGSGELRLDSKLLNAWLRMSGRSELRFLGEHAWVTLDGSLVKADLSVPLDPIGARGRYFNGRATFELSSVPGNVRFALLELVPDAEGAKGIETAAKVFSGIDLATPLRIEELVGEDLVKRCNIRVESSTLTLSCAAAAPGASGSETKIP